MGRDPHALTHVPPGAVHDQHELLARTRSRLLGKGGQRAGEQLHIDPRTQMPGGPPRSRMDVAHQIAPAIAGVNRDHGSLPAWRPDAAQDGLESDTMLIARPPLHRRSGMRLPDRRYLGLQLFFQAARSSGVAALVCRGRGACGVKSSRRR